MIKRFLAVIGLSLMTLTLSAQAQTQTQKKKFIDGYDGGMMVHTGFLSGTINPVGYKAKGLPMGIGGAIRFHVTEHFRFGTEGYVSTLNQSNDTVEDGSYIKYGWGGLMGDFYWEKGRFMPYVGLTVGGGSQTSYLMYEGDKHDWLPEISTIYNKTGFLAVDPYVGCDYIVSKAFHLTLKMDCLCAFSKGEMVMPTGPRLYLGFIFFH